MNDETKRTKLSVRISVISIMALSLILINGESFFPSANGQETMCDNLESNIALPVLLIHGYAEGPERWHQWKGLLDQENIPFCIVSFQQSNDACGSAEDHATELGQIIQNVISTTGQNQVNIVGYSKGGLDARVYLANSNSQDVANLIMIGTPNAGSPWAETTDACAPAIEDLRPEAPATMVEENTHTQYYTIAGSCLAFLPIIPEPNDGLVGISSVNSQSYFQPLGYSSNCHLNLLGGYEYGLAHDVLTTR
ncbi:MAG: alpha/beta fold hydrolase [Thermoproteota archaeon]|nr:alpha/beta fold hydrolase [Thermoproteota archaeon]